jgi:hypothetical protein
MKKKKQLLPVVEGATNIMSKVKIGDVDYEILGTTKREVSETAKPLFKERSRKARNQCLCFLSFAC